MFKSLHDLPSQTSRTSIFKCSFASSAHYESSCIQKLKAYPISGSLRGHRFQQNKIMQSENTLRIFKASSIQKDNLSWQEESFQFSEQILSPKLHRGIEWFYLRHYNILHRAGLLAYLAGLSAILYSGKKKTAPSSYHHYTSLLKNKVNNTLTACLGNSKALQRFLE